MPETRWVCRHCIATRGLRGADLGEWPALDDAEAQARHIESEHYIPVQRKGETADECLERFAKEYLGWKGEETPRG